MFTLVYCKTLLCQSSLYKFIARYFSFVHLWNIFSEKNRCKFMHCVGSGENYEFHW